MKGFVRSHPEAALCGLSCLLCPMELEGRCPGCGGGAGNQSCAIARCSLAHGGVEYCCACGAYPCERHEAVEEYDSFVTHQNRLQNLRRISEQGWEPFCHELVRKRELLERLLARYNDGRRKTLYCTAVNLLPLEDVEAAVDTLERSFREEESEKERAARAAALLQDMARRRGIQARLRRKPGKQSSGTV